MSYGDIDIEQLLDDAGVKSTPVRHLVVKAMTEAARPLSSQEIETILDTVDRSSITRTLALLTSHHLLHAVDDGSGSVRYEVCRVGGHHSHENGHETDLHPHFHCTRCGITECLEGVQMPDICLPEGYVDEGINCVIRGLCPKCKDKN